MSKFKGFADAKINVAKMMIYVFNRPENIVGKGENADYQHFLLFPQSFKGPFPRGCNKSGSCGTELKTSFCLFSPRFPTSESNTTSDWLH